MSARDAAAVVPSAVASAMPDEVGLEIARLRDLDLESLRARWRIVSGKAPPAHLSRQLLVRMLAYRLQADAFGDLDADSAATLANISAASMDADREQVTRQLRRTDAKLRPGTILTREWHDGVHRVTVLRDGFSWEGKTYRSLSAVASAIAGSRWNGHRFFGLRDAPPAGRR